MLDVLGLENPRARFACKHHPPPSAALGPREEPGDTNESSIEQSWPQAGFPSLRSKVEKSMASESVTECEIEN